MLKEKYLHRKSRESRYSRHHKPKKYKKIKNINLFDDLPFRQKIGTHSHWSNINTRPLLEFLESKIGGVWDDIYSEILKKIDDKYRNEIDYSIERYVNLHIFYEDYIPYYIKPYYQRGMKIPDNKMFVDYDGILTKKSKEELILEAKIQKRLNRLYEIFNE